MIAENVESIKIAEEREEETTMTVEREQWVEQQKVWAEEKVQERKNMSAAEQGESRSAGQGESRSVGQRESMTSEGRTFAEEGSQRSETCCDKCHIAR